MNVFSPKLRCEYTHSGFYEQLLCKQLSFHTTFSILCPRQINKAKGYRLQGRRKERTHQCGCKPTAAEGQVKFREL